MIRDSLGPITRFPDLRVQDGRALGSLHELQLDAARGFAAMVVALCHLVEVFWAPHLGLGGIAAHWIASISQHAVLIFFLLSGYLIFRNIQRNSSRHGRFKLTQYGIDRLARVYPPLLATILLCLLIHAAIVWLNLQGSQRHPIQSYGLGLVVPPVLTLGFTEVLRALALLHTTPALNIPLWSLFVEIKLYLIAGLLVAAGMWHWRSIFCVGLAGLVIWAAYDLQGSLFLGYASAWCMGALVANLRSASMRRWVLLSSAALAAVSLLLMLRLDPKMLSFLYGGGHGAPRIVIPLVLALFALVYAVLLFYIGWPKAWLSAFSKLAPWSYSLYLTNWPLLLLGFLLSYQWIRMDVGRTLLVSVLVFAVQIVVAMLVAVMLIGLALTISESLVLLIIGIGFYTFGFFSAHSVASSWVGRRATHSKALASAIYLCSYYLGSSLIGSSSGLMWAINGWHGVAMMLGLILLACFGITLRLRTLAPKT